MRLNSKKKKIVVRRNIRAFNVGSKNGFKRVDSVRIPNPKVKIQMSSGVTVLPSNNDHWKDVSSGSVAEKRRSRKLILFLIIGIWWVIFAAFSLSGYNKFNILNIVGFIFLLTVPGFLTLVAIERLDLEFWGYVAVMIGISLIEIIFVCLAGNIILPLIGISRPLDKNILLIELSLMIIVLIITGLARNKTHEVIVKKYLVFDTFRDLAFALFPIVFVVLSIIGSIRLNNEQGNTVTLGMLIGVGIYLAVLIRFANKLDKNVIPVALFFVSMSMLFMTSLRGWYITGHDIQREYRVFELTKNNGIWLMSNFRDAYNACMSITILPTVFYNLLKINDPYIYKIFFQIIFAIIPGIVYLIARKYVTSAIALISVVYFIAFPTFFSDMPMLNRQEMAFVFLALMFYLIFNDSIDLTKRRALFIVFGVGMVLSHYSTTYTVIALLIFLIFFRYILKKLAVYFQSRKIFSESSIGYFTKNNDLNTKKITISMVAILVVASFLWSSVLTDTSSNSVYRVISETVSVIRSNAKEDTRSGDILYSLFSWNKPDQSALLAEYQKKIVDPARAKGSNEIYYESYLYDKYEIKPAMPELLPITELGRFFESKGVDVISFNYNFRQLTAKALQVLIIIGIVFTTFRKRYTENTIDTEFIILVAGSLIFILSQILLPVLSAEYGLLRAFQQSLIFLGVFAVIGSATVIGYFAKKQYGNISGILAVIFLFSSTGVFTQLLGGYDPQLHLNNSGTSYNIYYLHSSEIAGVDWLQSLIQNDQRNEYQAEIQSDRYTSTKMRAIREVNPLDDIFPKLIRKDSYVFLGYSNVHKQKASTFYKGDLIMYDYPTQFLEDNKNLIYNNGDVKIYR